MNEKISISQTSRYSWEKISGADRPAFRVAFGGAFQGPCSAARFESLRTKLLAPVLGQAKDQDLVRRLRLGANEAAALAWTTPYPLLMFPCLLEEKTSAVQQHYRRQEEIRTASASWFPRWRPLVRRRVTASLSP